MLLRSAAAGLVPVVTTDRSRMERGIIALNYCTGSGRQRALAGRSGGAARHSGGCPNGRSWDAKYVTACLDPAHPDIGFVFQHNGQKYHIFKSISRIYGPDANRQSCPSSGYLDDIL